MKTPNFRKCLPVVALAALPLLGGCLGSSSGPEKTAATEVTPAEPAPATTAITNDESPALLEQEEQQALAQAEVTPSAGDKPVPASVRLTPELDEIIRMADAGVDEKVMLTYITNSSKAFNLGPDEIIYLNDLGVPSQAVTAMIEQDSALQEALARSVARDSSASQPLSQLPSQPDLVPVPANFTQPPEPPPGAFEATAPPVIDYPTEPYPPAGEPAPIASEQFYDNLAPYGTWVDVNGYGRCWQPSVAVIHSGWRPYCDGGHWVYTDCGWYWVSDYSWGWAPFHYGRWFQHARMGWCWLPDNVWGPSWVSWRYCNDYCGWAPLPPRACFTTAGFTYYGRSVSTSFSFGLTADCYTFVPFRSFHEHHLDQHRVRKDEVIHVFHRTVASTSFGRNHERVTNNGLTPEVVAAATHRPVRLTTVRTVTSNNLNEGGAGQTAGGGRISGANTITRRQPTAPAAAATTALPVNEVRQTGPVPAPAARNWRVTSPRQAASGGSIVRDTSAYGTGSAEPGNPTQATINDPITPPAPVAHRTAPRALPLRAASAGQQQAAHQPANPSWLVQPSTASANQSEPAAAVSRSGGWQNSHAAPNRPQTVTSASSQPETPNRPAWISSPQHTQPQPPRYIVTQAAETPSTVQTPVLPSPISAPPASTHGWTLPSHNSQSVTPQQSTHVAPVSHSAPSPAGSQANSSAQPARHESTPAASTSSSHSSQSSSDRESRSRR